MFYNIQWNFELCLDSFYWSHEHFNYKILIERECFKLEQRYSFAFSKFRSTVCCEHCKFCVYVEDWNQKCSSHHENSWEAHVHKSSQCSLIISYLADLKKRMKLIEKVEQVRIAKKRAESFACRRCSTRFSSNIKLHQHVQNHHQKKSAEIVKFDANESANVTSSEFATRTSTSESTSKAKFAKLTSSEIAMSTSLSTSKAKLAKSTSSESTEITSIAVSASITSSFTSKAVIAMFTHSATSIATSIATSKKSSFWVEIVSRSVIASKSSRFSISTSNKLSKALKTAAVVCSSTSSTIFSYSSESKHQKSYLIIENLYEMFVEKLKRMNLLHIKYHIKKSSTSSKLFNQVKITAYFRSAVNQSISISQSSKTSNSRSLHQHTIAKAIRTTFSKWFEKSIILSYKTSIFSRLFTLEISSVSSYKSSSISRCISCSFSSFTSQASFDIFVFSHACRICSDTFESNNDLHRHLRAIHFDQRSRHCQEKSRESRTLGRNATFRRFLIFWRRNDLFACFFICITNRFLMNRSHVLVTRHNESVVIFFVRWHLLRLNLHIEQKVDRDLNRD